MNRRGFFKLAGVATTCAVVGRNGEAKAAESPDETWGVLVDLTRCEGCRMCEFACAEANGLPEPDWSEDDSNEAQRPTTPSRWSTINRYETDQGEVFVKRQCMHCLQPACAAGCLTRALHKTDEGPVIWTEDRCIGCRYCMVSCPFDIPRFEYDSANPKITKCRMCYEKVQREGADGMPACVENCPNEALTFGKRGELLEVARRRIYGGDGEYVPHIYGEHEAGGTGWLYISAVPFEQLGFRTDLGTEPYPEKTRDFLTAVPLVLLLWPAAMMAVRRATVRDGEHETGNGDPEERHEHRHTP